MELISQLWCTFTDLGINAIAGAAVGGVATLLGILPRVNRRLRQLDEIGKGIKQLQEDSKRHTDGELELLRYSLMSLLPGILRRGEVTPDELYSVEHLYSQYEAFGGNGQVKAMYDKMHDLIISVD